MASLRSCTLAAAFALVSYVSADAGQQPLSDHNSRKPENPLTEDFEKYVHKLLDAYHVPGIAIGVIDGEDIYTEGYGIATLPDTPVTPDTLWYGASTSKAQTAAVLADLIASKNFTELADGWLTPISSIIRDDFVLFDEYATAHITLDDAASHRTGIGRHDLSGRAYIGDRPAVPRDVVRNLRNLPMAHEPRTKFLYSNFMFTTLSHVIETLTGKWLGDVLRERIWGPLGMDSTYLDLQDALDAPEHFADGYAWNSESEKFERIEFMNVTSISGAGGVISNVKNYAKWVRCLVNSAAPLAEEVHKDIRAPRMIMMDTPSSGLDVQLYGVGWMRTTFHGSVVYHHSGGMHAYGAEVFWLPDAKFGVVSFGNTAITSNYVQEILIYSLIEEKLGIPPKDRYDLDSERRKDLDKERVTREQALKRLFPNLPDKPLPSSFELEHLVGNYEDAGYGALSLRIADRAEKKGRKVLITDRSSMVFGHTMALEHVSGDYWTVEVNVGDKSEYMIQYLAANVVAGVDGKPSAWEVKLSTSADDRGDGMAIWRRVE